MSLSCNRRRQRRSLVVECACVSDAMNTQSVAAAWPVLLAKGHPPAAPTQRLNHRLGASHRRLCLESPPLQTELSSSPCRA